MFRNIDAVNTIFRVQDILVFIQYECCRKLRFISFVSAVLYAKGSCLAQLL